MAEIGLGAALAAIGAGVAIGFAGLGSGLGQGMAAAGSVGAVAEDNDMFARGIIFSALPDIHWFRRFRFRYGTRYRCSIFRRCYCRRQ